LPEYKWIIIKGKGCYKGKHKNAILALEHIGQGHGICDLLDSFLILIIPVDDTYFGSFTGQPR
jgi:hypothetical protein